MKKIVYLALGSNLGERKVHIEAAIEALKKLGAVPAVSPMYETEPVEVREQPWFLNCVVALETSLMPRQLLSGVLAIEQQMGRRRARLKGPRTIDIDILLFGSSIVNTSALTIPHPALHERRFVLEPLAQIAPDLRHPVLKKTIRELRDELTSGGVVKLLTSGS